jgi:hypothetical protein
VAGGERPPRQAREHTGRADREIDVPVVASCRVEQRPRPRQITEPSGGRPADQQSGQGLGQVHP